MPKRYPTVEEKRLVMKMQAEGTAGVLGRRTRFELIPNNMAAGPCEHCLAAATKTYTVAKLPLLPLPKCPHPDQCVGHARVVLDLD